MGAASRPRPRISNVCLKWLNIFTLILSLPLICIGIWLYTVRGSSCVSFLQKPVIALGVITFFVSLLGMLGAAKSWSFVLWLYLVFLSFIIIVLSGFTIFAFVVSGSGGGKSVEDVGFQQYYLGDYAKWLQDELKNRQNWERVQSCMVDAKVCSSMQTKYPTVSVFRAANLTSTESGCCRPPVECGFPQTNTTIFDLSRPSVSNNTDCPRFQPSPNFCFSCDSCRAGVADYVIHEWRPAADVLLAVTLLLLMVCACGCCATYNVDGDIEFQEINRGRQSSYV